PPLRAENSDREIPQPAPASGEVKNCQCLFRPPPGIPATDRLLQKPKALVCSQPATSQRGQPITEEKLRRRHRDAKETFPCLRTKRRTSCSSACAHTPYSWEKGRASSESR